MRFSIAIVLLTPYTLQNTCSIMACRKRRRGGLGSSIAGGSAAAPAGNALEHRRASGSACPAAQWCCNAPHRCHAASTLPTAAHLVRNHTEKAGRCESDGQQEVQGCRQMAQAQLGDHQGGQVLQERGM